jgi:hypothetical protein
MYSAYLAQSQVFVGIYWQRYGWVAPGMEISGLEDEFRLAAGKPMLLYLKRPAPDQEPRLAAMIDTIRAAGTASYRAFGTPRELERLLADDLAVLLSESFEGTVLGTQASPTSPGEPGEADLPAGTVTFLFTDIEGSTRLWESVPDAMEVALEQHNRLLTELIEGHGGVVVTSRGEGDSFFAVFPARWPRSRRPAPVNSPFIPSRGRRVPCCGCGWGCTPGKHVPAEATASTTGRSTAAHG